MPSLTPNYDFYLPLVNDPTDEDLWGGYLNDNFSSLDTIIFALASATPPTIPAGVINAFAGTSVPSGWLECDGSAVSRSTYAALFTAIGTTYGTGDGATTFNLPLTARRTLVGRGGTGTATLANTVGSVGGSETHTLVTGEIPSHTHTGNTDNSGTHTHTLDSSVSGAGSNRNIWGTSNNGSAFSLSTDSGSGTHTHTILTDATGGGGAHNNIQPSLVTMMIIKT